MSILLIFLQCREYTLSIVLMNIRSKEKFNHTFSKPLVLKLLHNVFIVIYRVKWKINWWHKKKYLFVEIGNKTLIEDSWINNDYTIQNIEQLIATIGGILGFLVSYIIIFIFLCHMQTAFNFSTTWRVMAFTPRFHNINLTTHTDTINSQINITYGYDLVWTSLS